MARKSKSTPKTLIEKGEELVKLGKVEEAIKCFDKELAINPNNWKALNFKGYCLLWLKKLDEAKLCFEQSLEKDDTKAESWGFLGTYYFMRQDVENSHKCFKKAENLDGNELSYSQIAYHYYCIKEYDKSELYVEKTLSINEKNESALNTKGLLYVSYEDYTNAVNTFRLLTKLNNSSSLYYGNLGYAYFLNKQVEKANKALEKSIIFDSTNSFTYNHLAILSYSQSKFDKALEYIELAILHNADIPKFSENKAEILISIIKSGDISKGSFQDVGYFFSRANLSAIDVIIALNSSTIEFLKDEKDQIIRGMINMDIFYAETIRDCKVAKEDYLRIYQKSLEIVALLEASDLEELDFAHYTTQETANSLIFHNSPFRLHSVTTANDPKEGYPLLNFIGFTGAFSPNIYQAFIGSFTFNPDSLNQFRLYGKNNNIEGSGVSLILSFDYFGESANINHALVTPTKLISSVTKQPLFRCVYIDPVSRRVISLGHKEACAFYREDLNSNKNEMDEKVEKYLSFINEQKTKVEGALNELNIEIHDTYNAIHDNEDKKNEAIKIIPLLLIHLRYLVKHYDFKEEQECRIIQVEPLKNNSRITVTGDYSRMYVNYLTFHKDNKSYLKKIYWGPKTSNFELFKDRITHLGMNILCLKNEHPFN
jgi:tetratricopeptide (TPR) repeat protein